MIRNLPNQLLLLLFVFRPIFGQIPQQGLKAHFSFDNNLVNQVNKTHLASLHGPKFDADRFNRPRFALSLNGDKQYVSLGNSKLLKPETGVTVALWAYKNDWQKNKSAHLISNYEFAGFYLSVSSGKTLTANIKTSEGGLSISYSISTLSEGWHHFCLTFDGKDFVLYVDSQLVGKTSSPSKATIEQHASNATFLGVSASRDVVPWYFEDNYFEGMLDDLFVYDRALTHQEVIYLFEDAPPIEMKGFVYDRNSGKKISAEVDIDAVKYTATAEKGYKAQLKPKAGDKIIHISAKGYYTKFYRIEQGVYPFEFNFEIDPIKINEAIVLSNIEFDQNSAQVAPSSFAYLDTIVLMLSQNPTIKIEISGHTDIIGNPKANQALSEKRALSVSNYLISKGIDRARVKSVGFGGAFPLSSEDDDEKRKKNRRVEFKVLSY